MSKWFKGDGDHAQPGAQQSSGTDPVFLKRLQAGDERAWEALLQQWQQPLYRYLCYTLSDAEQASDILGETLVALVQAIQNFDGRVALSTFIFKIASNKTIDYWRKKKVTTRLLSWELSVDGPNSQRLELQEALATLPEEYRQALLLRYHIGLSVTEVAEVLGKSYKATESLLSRGRKRLKAALKGASE